jgi:KipI family sensor histidine kinase inhibitor
VELTPVSESAVLVEFPGRSDDDANRAAVALAERLSTRRLPGLFDAIPGARTLFVSFDPRARSSGAIDRTLRRLAARGGPAPQLSRRFRIPVAYGGESGPDLATVARELGMEPEELARRHAGAEYRVAFLGFSPGFPYLTGLPPELAVARLPNPRPRLAAGSVAIAGGYSAIYPAETPGGWRLIGRTAVSLFDARATPPALLAPGDRVSFEAIGEEELRRRFARRSAPEKREPALEGEPLFEVLAPGVFTSIQGAPRFGLGSLGVPAGGAMDPGALAAGNALVGNPSGAAALEMTLSGPELLFRSDAVVALAGADLDAEWNGEAAPHGEAIPVREGDRFAFGRARAGVRAYLCVAGGLRQPSPAQTTRRLARGDVVLRAGPGEPNAAAPPIRPARASGGDALALRALPGPQAAVLDEGSPDRFFGATYRVSGESDRRGIRLEGPALALRRSPDIPPEGTAQGAIQVPGNGLPIVLGPDRPVTGGYAKFATVIARDWPILAQAPPGAAVRFVPVTLAEAMEELRRAPA